MEALTLYCTCLRLFFLTVGLDSNLRVINWCQVKDKVNWLATMRVNNDVQGLYSFILEDIPLVVFYLSARDETHFFFLTRHSVGFTLLINENWEKSFFFFFRGTAQKSNNRRKQLNIFYFALKNIFRGIHINRPEIFNETVFPIPISFREKLIKAHYRIFP